MRRPATVPSEYTDPYGSFLHPLTTLNNARYDSYLHPYPGTTPISTPTPNRYDSYFVRTGDPYPRYVLLSPPLTTYNNARYDSYFVRTAAFDVPAEGMSAFAQEMDDLQARCRGDAGEI